MIAWASRAPHAYSNGGRRLTAAPLDCCNSHSVIIRHLTSDPRHTLALFFATPLLSFHHMLFGYHFKSFYFFLSLSLSTSYFITITIFHLFSLLHPVSLYLSPLLSISFPTPFSLHFAILSLNRFITHWLVTAVIHAVPSDFTGFRQDTFQKQTLAGHMNTSYHT